MARSLVCQDLLTKALPSKLGRWYWLRKSDLGASYGYLPIHDAIAVELDHMTWACDARRESWEPEIERIPKGAKATVSTEIADV